MRPFVFERADSPAAAVLAAAGQAEGDEEAQFLAGGTTLIDLMKLDVMRPEMVIDINALSAPRLDALMPTPAACGSARWSVWQTLPIILLFAAIIR